MDQDPYQTLNLAGEQSDRVDGCYRLMAQWVDERLGKDGWHLDPLMAVLRDRGMSG